MSTRHSSQRRDLVAALVKAATAPACRRVGCALLIFSLAISGCSIARLAYNNVDWLLLREMNDFLDLSPEQEMRAAARLREALQTHRRTELPGYAHFLARLRRMAESGLDVRKADWIVERGYALVKRTIRHTVPAISPSLTDLSSRQIAHLESRLAEFNREYRDEYLPESLEIRKERRVRRTVDRIEHWVGALRSDQFTLASRLRNTFPDSAEAWLAYNIDQQRVLLDLLKSKRDVETLESFLIGWWVELRGRTPALEKKNRAVIEGIKHMIVSIDATLDENQRSHLLHRLDGYIDQVEILRKQQ